MKFRTSKDASEIGMKPRLARTLSDYHPFDANDAIRRQVPKSAKPSFPCSLSALKMRRALVRGEYGKQLGETGFVVVAQGRLSVGVDPVRMLPSQGFANLRAKFGVGVDLVAHGCDTLNGWLSSDGCIDVDFWESLGSAALCQSSAWVWMTFEVVADQAA